ncbi:MAG: rhomboid family intramembrane serine protease [Isosphaeraceae bacterium]|nr:rhomboid family intramembrane serine protease [Isosphaeraceae bacterium]
MLRRLRRDFRDYPATMTICTLWVVVYLAMLATAACQGNAGSGGGWLLGTPGGERFGDMSLRDLARGQYWRTLTSTFVHYGLVHLAMNLFGMYQLGSLIEEWYGPWQTVSLYVVLGAGGNALSAVIRHALGSNPYMHSGGGSTVLLGFVGLCAVVGWRARTRMGDFLRGQMVAILLYTALLGLALPLINYIVPMPLIDNWGHAGGALVGAAVGFEHSWLERRNRSRLAVWVAALAILVLTASAALQWRSDRVEAPRRALARMERARTIVDALARVAYQYQVDFVAAQRARTGGRGAFVSKERLGAISFAQSQLGLTRQSLDNGATRGDFQRVQALLSRARNDPPRRRDVETFAPPFRNLLQRARRAYDAAAAEYAAVARQEGEIGATTKASR